MTQEEMDALMSGDIDEMDEMQELEKSEDEPKSSPSKSEPDGYSDDNSHHWPLPATDENKMVHQLDDVTKESEEKASEIFDIIENISNDLMEKEESLTKITDTLKSNVELFVNLSKKFPDVAVFETQLEKNRLALSECSQTIETLQNSGDSIMQIMDIMQYQDIHRQKIERVINVMRALSKYMSTLFEGKMDDDKRAPSAQHLSGDAHDDIQSDDDIEALLAQFGK